MKQIIQKIFILAIAGCQFSLVNYASAQTTLSLNEAVELARLHNRTLSNAALDIEMAGEQRKEAHTKYFPQISAQVLAFRTFDELMKGEGIIPMEVAALGEQFAALAGQPFSYSELNRGYSATLNIMQPLYAGGQIRTGNKLAALQEDVAKLQLEMKEKDVVQRVTEGFWQIATIKYNLQTLDAADKQMEEALKTVETYVKAGLTQRNDLLKVQLRRQELASNRLKLNNAEHVLRLLLAQMVGMAGQDVDIDAQTMQAESPSTLFVQSAEAVQNRPELQLAQKGVEAQQLQVKMERSKLLPTVAVGVMGMHSDFGGLTKMMEQYWNHRITNGLVMGTVSVPISDWWGGKHAIRRQKLKLQQAQNDALEAQEQLQIDIESAWSNLTEAYNQVSIAQQSVEQAEENLRLVNDQYRAGTIALTDLLDAETLNRQAHTQLSTALASYQIQRSAYILKVKQ